jgi:endonuclease/exonuclease/phosphatase family metal-dependent hydrolase
MKKLSKGQRHKPSTSSKSPSNEPDNYLANGTIDTRLRVLTWNIWWRFGHWEQRRPAIEATLGRIDADVIALQEVWRDESTNLAAELATALGYHHVFESSMDIEGIGFGNALLSRWPIKRCGSVVLHGLEEAGEGRIALFAEINGPRGLFPMFSTHLNWKADQSHIRQCQVTDLVHFVDSVRPWSFPPIVCGDFNADPSSEEIRMLEGLTNYPVEGLVFYDAWSVAGGEGAGTTCDSTNPYIAPKLKPDRRLDYIFVGEPQASSAGQIVECKVVGNEPVDGVWPSDHHAVLAELRY